jgi:flagellar assembly protein FliH
LYNRIFKNNQVTYGRPYQIKIPAKLQNFNEEEEQDEDLHLQFESEEVESPEAILEKAREEAALIIKEAEYEAARIMEDAHAEAEKNTKAILENAWQKGYDEGNESAKEQYAGIIMEAEATRESAMEEHDKVLAGIETEIIDLVTEVSKRVIGAELSTNRDSIISLVRLALEKCSNKNNLVLKVASGDYEYLLENRDRFNMMVQGAGDMELRQDQSLEPGSCLVETPFGSIDASAQTRMRKIEEAFIDILEGR